MDLWPHQSRGLNSIHAAIDCGYRQIVVAAPCGAGKTVMMGELIKPYESKGVVLYTQRRMLREQISVVLESSGIWHGVRAAGEKPALLRNIQVSSMQTEHARAMKGDEWELHDAGLVIVDECHNGGGPTSKAILKAHKDAGAIIVGFTASPLNLDHEYDHLIVAGTNSEMRACGAHVPAQTYGPDEPDLRHIKKYKVGDDLSVKDNSKAMMRPGIFARVYDWWKRLNPDARPALLFAPGVDESVWFAEQFRAAGVRVAHIDGENVWIDGDVYAGDREVRDQVLSESRSGDIKVICNRFVMREGIDCLDAETEILSVNGWKKCGEILQGDMVYTLNRQSGLMEISPCERVFSREVGPEEKIVRIKSQHMDIRVTQNHEFHVRGGNPACDGRLSKKWITMKASEFAERKSDVHFPVSAKPSPMLFWQGVPLTDDELRFVAWFMTDGYRHKGKNKSIIEICQSKIFHHEIRDLLKRLGYSFRESIKTSKTGYKPGSVSFRFNVPSGVRGGRAGWSSIESYIDKAGSPLLRRMTREQFKVFWDELLKGDGQIKGGKKNGTLICSPSQADLYSELAITRGFACGVYSFKTKKGVSMRLVRIRDKQFLGTRPADKRSATCDISDPVPGEVVWCVTNNNGTVVTRRNGKICILGNCPWLYHGIFATIFGSLTTFIQSGGRLLRSYPGLDHVVIQDHGGNWHRHGSLNADRHWELRLTDEIACGEFEEKCRDQNKKKEEVRSEGICCVKCSAIRSHGNSCPYCGFVSPLRTRAVVQVEGHLKQQEGEIHKQRIVREKVDTEQIWEKTYWRAKNSGMTFRQAEGLFFYEQHYYPPRTLKFMPTNSRDWYRKVEAVHPSRLIGFDS